MTSELGQRTDLAPLFLRATYFGQPRTQEPRRLDVPWVAPAAVPIAVAAAALSQTAEFFVAAERLSWRPDADLNPVYAPRVEVVSIEMRSPLAIVVNLPWFALKAGGYIAGVLYLAERISTFPLRVSRKRKEELLNIAALDRMRTNIQQGDADDLARMLVTGTFGLRPDHMDFLDPAKTADDDLDPLGPEA